MKAHFIVHDKFEETKYEVFSPEELWKQFLHVRLNTVLPLRCEATIAGVKNSLQNKRKKVKLITQTKTSFLLHLFTFTF